MLRSTRPQRLLATVASSAALLSPAPASAQTALDTQPPQLTSFGFTPTTVDLAAGDATVVVTARWTDLSGVADTGPERVTFTSTTTPQSYSAFLSRVSSTATEATYRGVATLPRAASPGSWPVGLSAPSDTLGNTSGFSEPAGSRNALTVLNSGGAPDAEQPVAPDIDVDRPVIDHGTSHRLTVSGRVGAPVELYGNGRSIRTATIPASGSFTWELRPGLRTVFSAVVDSTTTPNVLVLVRRTVDIGMRRASGAYAFTGVIDRPEAGVHVTVARLDAATKQVTGIASTRTDGAGRYDIRTRLPAGQAGYYALTSATPRLLAGRSRLYGVVVPAAAAGNGRASAAAR